MPNPPYPKMYNPFLVTEPEYTVPTQLAGQQTVYPQMTSTNQMQMFDEALIKNNLDRINPDKSIYLDPISSPQITPREYNQPNALQQRLSNYSNIIKGINDAPTNNGIEVPIVDPNTVNSEPLVYDTLTGLPIQNKQQSTNSNVDIEEISGIEKDLGANLDFVPYANDVEYIRSLRKPEYEINLKPYVDSFGTFVPPVVSESIPAAPKQMNYMAKIDSEMIPLKDFAAQNVQTPEPDPYKSNEPEITLSNKTNITEPVTTKQNKFGTPEAYYLGKSMLDATALINNMVQPQPPSIQMKLPHYERQRLNPEPYDTMRSQMRDQGTQAYRLQRENISQASDLMKGLAAVTSGTQQGLMQVGMQQAGAEQQIQGINQQISMQEQAAQTQILNQEATTNYQIQAQAQQFKDQMISAQLARLGDTAGAYAKYANMKDIATKQDLVNKAAIQSTNEIQNAMLQYQLQKDAMDSDEYKSAWSQHWNKSLDQLSIDKLSDEKYNLVKEYYGETTPSYGDFRRRATNPVFIQDYYQKRNAYDMFQKLYPGGVAPDRSKYSNDTDYNNALADFKKYEQDSKAYNDNKSYKTFEQEQDFWTTLSKEKNETAERKKFADQYMKDRGIFTSEQLMESIQASLDRSRQSLEIGG